MSLAGTGKNEKRLHLFLSNTETDSPSPPFLMKSGKRKQRQPLFYRLLRGGGRLTWHIPQKQEAEGGLCTALTPSGVDDNPVIIARDYGKPCGRESYSEETLTREPYYRGQWRLLSKLKSHTFTAPSQTLCTLLSFACWMGEMGHIRGGVIMGEEPPCGVPHGPVLTSLLLLFLTLLRTN